MLADPLLLSRARFGLAIAFNIPFPRIIIVPPMIVGYTVFACRVFWGKARSLGYGE